MRIAVLSDSHDNVWRLEAAFPHLRQADVILHCGDLCAPFMVRLLAEGAQDRPVHIVWGNNDGDTFLIARVAQAYPNVVLHGLLAEIELDGLSVAVNHYPRIARALALSGQYRMVCYGHDHTAQEERLGGCLLLNPGELMGMKGRSSLALVEAEDLSVRWVEL